MRYLNLDATPAVRVEDGLAELPPMAESRTKALARLCGSLQANPVLHLSLGSKELFHSNFLGWLFERSADVAREALEPWTSSDSAQQLHRVRREHHNLDLTVEVPGLAPVVIENKVFSLPSEAQLDRYAEANIPASGLLGATMLLLSLSDPGWSGRTYRGWTWVSYTDLAQRVAAAVRAHLGEDQFTVQLVEHWVHMVEDLQGIVEHTRPDDVREPLLLDGDAVELLRTVRLHDAFQKFRTRAVLHLLERQYAACDLAFDSSDSSFSNGSPLLEARVRLADGSQIGWQLQGSQWRRFLVVPPELAGATEGKKQERIAYAKSRHQGWFTFSQEQLHGPFAPAPSTIYKHYAPDFLYDYARAPGLSVEQVLALGETTLRAANEYRSEFDARAR